VLPGEASGPPVKADAILNFGLRAIPAIQKQFNQ
jgi:hypothetical protein